MKTTNFLYAACLSLGLLTGCNDNILNLEDPNRYTESNYYKTLDECKSAVLSCYSLLINEPGHCRSWHLIMDYMAGHAAPTPNQSNYNLFYDHTYRTDFDLVKKLWNSLYVINFRSLNAIEKIEAWEAKTDEEKQEKQILLGEAHFFHAWAYYYLTQLWGDVPYHPTFESNKAEYIKPRTSYKDIENKLITEHLPNAIQMLPEKYDANNLGRVNKAAARTLLAKIYLGQGKYKEAQDQLAQITGYEYHDDYYGLFTNGNHTSKEIIMEVIHWYYGAGNGTDGHFFRDREDRGDMQSTVCRPREYGFNDWWNCYIPIEAANQFKYNINSVDGLIQDYVDPRARSIMYGDGTLGDDTFNSIRSDGTEDIYKGKYQYKPYDGTKGTGHNWKKYQYYEECATNNIIPDAKMASVLMRLADVRLLLAEAYIGQKNYSEALKIINEVRTRNAVQAKAYSSMDESNALEILKRERYIELFGEQQFIFDLIRWDRLGLIDMIDELQRITADKDIDPKFKKLPIPQSEKDTNPLIETSDGWN